VSADVEPEALVMDRAGEAADLHVLLADDHGLTPSDEFVRGRQAGGACADDNDGRSDEKRGVSSIPSPRVAATPRVRPPVFQAGGTDPLLSITLRDGRQAGAPSGPSGR
jgi:hypothetical protein